MKDKPQPRITHSKPFPFVWVVPVIALLVGSYLVFSEFSGTGPRITILFNEAGGIKAGETVLQHKGLAVGAVVSATLTEDLQQVEVLVELQKSARGLARAGSRFWINRPQIGLQGIRGLDTLLSGPTLQVAPGTGPVEERFIGLDRPPLEGAQAGRDFTLTTKTLGSLTPGAPVMYRDLKVGEVMDADLSPDATSVAIRIHVRSPYHRLVRVSSRFWNASGINMKVGLLGARIDTQSLQSVLTGGVSFATSDEASEPASEHHVFKLHAEAEKEWVEWEPAISLETAPLEAHENAPLASAGDSEGS